MKDVCSELRGFVEQLRINLEQVKQKATSGARKALALETRFGASDSAIARMEQSLADLRAQIDSQGATTKANEDSLSITLKNIEVALRNEFGERLESFAVQITEQASAHSEAWKRLDASLRNNRQSTDAHLEDLRACFRNLQTTAESSLHESERLLRAELSEQVNNGLQ